MGRRLRLINCLAYSSISRPTTVADSETSASLQFKTQLVSWLDQTLVSAFSGVLSFGLLVSLPLVIALETPSLQASISPHLTSSEICREVEPEDRNDTSLEVVTNEGIVEEAWKIVNDSFLDAGGRLWSQESWQVIADRNSILYFQQKKKDILSNSIQTRSKAHQIVKRMLASLGDPYMRFLSPEEVTDSSFSLAT